MKRKKSEIEANLLSCVRLSKSHHHKCLIRGFNSYRAPGLSNYLKYNAWHEETTNYRAYYLILDGEKIVMYFSLQCGLLIQCHKKMLGGIGHQTGTQGIEHFIDDDKIDVTTVLPGIELAHLCANDSYRRRKATTKIKHGIWEFPLGVYVFYKFIGPQIIEVAKNSGLQYVYLFCADDGTEKLINYYSNELHFAIMDDMSCIRQEYDGGLCCMTLKIKTLIKDTQFFNDMTKVADVIAYLRANRTISSQQACKTLSINHPHKLLRKMAEAGVVNIEAYSPTNEPIRVALSPNWND